MSPTPPLRPDRRVLPTLFAHTLDRRRFLQLAGLGAAAAAFHPIALVPRMASAQQPGQVKALVEDLKLGPNELGAGDLDGLTATPRGIVLAGGRGRGAYVSPVLTAKTPFTHVGLHWLAESSDALAFEVRNSVDGRGWSSWEPVLIEAHGRDDAAARETFGALVAADRATRVQFRAVFEDRGRPALLQGVTATLINSKDGPTAVSLEAASASAPTLTSGGAVLTREDWGADPGLRFQGASEVWPRMYVPSKKVAVHHTATSNSYSGLEEAKAEVRAIYTYHAVTLGWGDIGYNILIDKSGNVFEGRHTRGEGDSRETFGPDVVAGHAASHNYGSTGIAMLGTYTAGGEGGRPGISLSTAARTSLVDVLAWECDRQHIDPQGAGDFLRSDDAWNTGLANVCGHRDCVSTICPGGNVYNELPSLRSAVASRLGSGRGLGIELVSSATQTVPLGSVGGVQFDWASGGASGFQLLLEGWRRLAGSEDIVYLAGFDAARYAAWQPSTTASETFSELFGAFGLGNLEAGHYTFHVRASGDGTHSYQAERTLLVTDDGSGGGGGSNTAPEVSISSPSDGANFSEGDLVDFAGTATDSEDGDVSGDIVWTSSLDGSIGSGASFSTASLGPGTHTITASVTDSGGLTGSDSITVTVETASGGSLTLSATAYKVRGVQHVDLAWSGATTGVTIYRDNNAIETMDGTSYTDNIGARGGGSYTYRVEAGGMVSNNATVSF